MRLLLIRHGLTDWNENGRLLGRIDIGLNERGRAQVETLATALRPIRLGAVLASPQRRTQETAAILAASQGLAVRTEASLDEVWLGRWQGKTFAEIADDPDLRRILEDPTYVCDAIEPAVEVQARVVAAVERVRGEFSETVALVSHGDPLRLILAHYLSMELRGFRQLVVSPASVSLLSLGSRGSRVLALNWKPGADALAELVPTRTR